MSIQEALKILRLELGWTQTDLAEKINKTYITVNRWENGKSFPSRANARDILEAAKDGNASDDCIAYLNEVLLPDCKRGQTGGEYGFPEIDRDFLFQIADNSANIAYVVEAKTHTMLYANRTAEKLISRIRAKSGNANEESRLEKNKDRRCFHYLLNKTEPCSFCPLIHTKNLTSWDGIQTSSESGKTYNIHVKKTYLHEKEVYIIYLSDISSLAQERMALYQMTNDIPNGVGIYNVYLDGRKELVFMNSAYYKPQRKVLIKRGETATEYFTYCEEVGCDVWGLLTSMKSISGEPVCLWLPEKYRKPGTSEYVQGVEVPVNYEGEIPEDFDVITLPEAEYMMFRGEPFEEEDYCEAIEGVQASIKKYDPTLTGYAWDTTNPRIQLEPIGTRGYIEMLAIKQMA